MSNNTTADTTAGDAGGTVAGPFWGYEFVRNDGVVLIERREAEGRIDTLRAQLEAAEAEVRAIWDAMPATLRYLDLPDGGDVPLPEQVRRMGEDVVNQQARAEAAEAEKREAWAAVESKAGWEWKKRAEAAEAEVARLGAVLDRIAGYTLSQFAGPCDMVVQCVHDAMAARTKEATP